MTTAWRRALVAAAVTVALAGSACGKEEEAVVAPRPVPDGLVPPSVHQSQLAFYDSELPGVREAFSEAGPDSLASDGRLWELRTGDRLVGVLQLTTLMPEVDLHEKKHRESILRQLMPSVRDRIDIGDVPVWTSTASGKSTFLWFGDRMFALLTMKPGSEDAIEPETVVREVLDHMVASDSWEYVYFDDEEEES